MPVGYSGTPLVKKLGIGAGSHVAVLNKPVEYESLLGELPEGVKLGEAVPVWVSWPKKAARVPTDITEDTIREVALPRGSAGYLVPRGPSSTPVASAYREP